MTFSEEDSKQHIFDECDKMDQ